MDYTKLDAILEKEGLKRAKFNEDSIENKCTLFFEDILKGIEKQITTKEININIYWIDQADKVNATVILLDDTYFIGLFSGVISALRIHFDTYYRYSQEDFKHFVLPIQDLYIDFEFDEADATKSKICNYLMSCAITYLVMHEFGHILCGHCEEKESFYYEGNSESKDMLGYKSQAKEMWADFYGIANSYNIFLCTHIKNPNSVGPYSVLYLLSVYSIFWIFNYYRDELSKCDCSKMSHPHPQVRFMYFIDLLQDELHHSIEMFVNHEEIIAEKDAAKQIFEAVLEDFMSVVSRTDLSFMYDEETIQRCDIEINKIKAELKSVVEIYKKGAYVLPQLS